MLFCSLADVPVFHNRLENTEQVQVHKRKSQCRNSKNDVHTPRECFAALGRYQFLGNNGFIEYNSSGKSCGLAKTFSVDMALLHWRVKGRVTPFWWQRSCPAPGDRRGGPDHAVEHHSSAGYLALLTGSMRARSLRLISRFGSADCGLDEFAPAVGLQRPGRPRRDRRSQLRSGWRWYPRLARSSLAPGPRRRLSRLSGGVRRSRHFQCPSKVQLAPLPSDLLKLIGVPLSRLNSYKPFCSARDA